MKFIPNPERPILSPEDLRLYRKGALKPEQFERLTERVTERKIQFKNGATVRELIGGEIIEENLTDEMKKELGRTMHGANKVAPENNQKKQVKEHTNEGSSQNDHKKRKRKRKNKNKQENNNLPPITEGKPQIRIVGEFSDNQKNTEKKDQPPKDDQQPKEPKNESQEKEVYREEKKEKGEDNNFEKLTPINPGDKISFG